MENIKNNNNNNLDSNGKINVVGHAAIDYIFDLDKFPELNTSVQIPSAKKYYGGAASNVAAQISNMGINSSLISCVGTDFITSGYEEYLKDLGVSLDFVYTSTEEETPKAWIFTDPDANQITYFLWGAAKHYKEIIVPDFDGDIVHLSTGDPEYNIKCAKKAKELNKLVSFDPGQDLTLYSAENLEEIINYVDFLFMNHHEYRRIMETINKTPEGMKNKLNYLIVTYNKDGSHIYHEGEEIKVPAIMVEAMDPTGAGDSYRAGFLSAYLKGYSLESCGYVGACVASYVVEKVGCQTNLPKWDKITDRLSEKLNYTLKEL
ncbi:ribokinase [Methanococcus voltae PS]|uniref:Ribokinase n=1 Tax=Methanococcus voltae PS TaxID=523842 RepID=A0ABT2EWY8_METVO|nr:carbohydrate kinase family protein [Methanococcus voltae]MCS3922467.1 ribokinase [Methanococcus voltae PS]